MSESESTAPTPAPEPLDPKEAMRRALERKREAEHASTANGINAERSQGQAHGKVAGKRQFRRKSGG